MKHSSSSIGSGNSGACMALKMHLLYYAQYCAVTELHKGLIPCIGLSDAAPSHLALCFKPALSLAMACMQTNSRATASGV